MGDVWMVLKAEKTVKKRIIIEDGEKTKTKIYEHCTLCFETRCDLYGYYGTWNEFGSFRGICSKCLKRILDLKKLKEKEEKDVSSTNKNI